MSDYTIYTDNLSVGYDGKPLIEHISIGLNRGEIVTLIGPNGAGKSTILKTIIGQLKLLGGVVCLNGEDMARQSSQSVSRQMAILMTERVRPELMTCWDVAATGRYPYTGRMGLLSREDRSIVEQTLEQVGGLELADKPFSAVSDGQRQRILLARALCQQPDILVLDEPTSFLDIRYQLELLTILKNMTAQRQMAVLVSIHELELAERISDRVVCVQGDRIDRVGTPEQVFTRDYIVQLYHMEPERYHPCFRSLRYVAPEEGEQPEEHYVQSGSKRLRCGYTTGTCAALAASGAAQRLLLERFPPKVSLMTPRGWKIEAALEQQDWGEGWAACGVRKDGGDDVDETHGALICARVEPDPQPGVRILGGSGVGRVTKPGLDQPVGESAINRVPRQMISQAVEQVCRLADYAGGLRVTISVPGGEEIAKKPFNPKLGIEGGISILGTSGVVEPMSTQALIDTIAVELRQVAAQGGRQVILTPGNYGLDFLKAQGMDRLDVPVVRCSNFIGESLDAASVLDFQSVLLVGHMGKLVKLAAGIMNTHSRWADGRGELFCAHAAIAGASPQLCRELMDAATTDACLELLEQAGLREPVLASLLERIQSHLSRRAGGRYQIGAVIFSNVYGELGRTDGAKELLEQWN